VVDFQLRVGANRYSGWKSLQVERGIEQLAHSVTVNATDRWVQDQEAVPIEAGDKYFVLMDGVVVSSGYVDEDSISYSASDRSLSFSGRSKTSDLVDCAAVYQKGQWRNVGLLQIAADLCSPFGISVSTRVDLGKVFRNPNFKLQEGESAFECLSRAARMRGVLMQTDENGDLFFDRAGSGRVSTVLRYGDNIISGSKTNSWKDRFGTYIIKTQAAGNDGFSGRNLSIKRTATDSGIDRYRPTIIMADTEDSGTELQKRVDWERNVRAGRAKKLTYTVQGWEHSAGLWDPNTIVKVDDSVARIKDELLITNVLFSRDDQGTFTTLSLSFPQAFDVQPLPPPKRKSTSLF